jgi:CBS domain-containing protein
MARVQDIMTARVVTVRSDSPISTAVERMTRYGFSALPVVSGSHRLVGIVSLLDIIRHREVPGPTGAVDDALDDALVEEVMNPDVLSLKPNANASVVAHRLHTHGELRVMPVVEGGVLVGVVTRSDLLRPKQRRGVLGGLLDRLRGGSDDEVLLSLARPRKPAPAAPTASVRAVMAADVVSIGPEESVEHAAEVLLHHRFTALPVIDAQRRLIGVVSEADLLRHRPVGRHGPRTVKGVMSTPPIALEVTATVAQARALIADRGLRVVPVVENGRLVGVFSRSDLV